MNRNEQTKTVISNELIFLESQLSTQAEVIQFIVKQAVAKGYVSDFTDLYTTVLCREQEIPTAIGYQIAMPHGKTVAVDFPFIAFLRVKEAFQWTDENEEQVRLIFLIGVPEESQGHLHLKFISQLSKKLLNDEFRARLLTETDRNKVFEQLRLMEVDT